MKISYNTIFATFLSLTLPVSLISCDSGGSSSTESPSVDSISSELPSSLKALDQIQLDFGGGNISSVTITSENVLAFTNTFDTGLTYTDISVYSYDGSTAVKTLKANPNSLSDAAVLHRLNDEVSIANGSLNTLMASYSAETWTRVEMLQVVKAVSESAQDINISFGSDSAGKLHFFILREVTATATTANGTEGSYVETGLGLTFSEGLFFIDGEDMTVTESPVITFK